jgi:hypothetical protein
VVVKILNHILKWEVQQGCIKGIKLLEALEPQMVTQFANDSSLSIRGEEPYVQATVDTLLNFSLF